MENGEIYSNNWLTIDDEDCVIVMPQSDSEPHGFPQKGEIKTELAGLDCPCKPKISFGNGEGLYEKPMIVHNSFRDKKVFEQLITSLFK